MREDPLRILLVEDNPGDARLIQEMMKHQWSIPFELQQVDRLSTALDLLSRAHVSVVLLDLALPDSHGLETLSRILGQTSMVPIVVLTGMDDEETGVKAVQMGAQDYLVKSQVAGDLLLRQLRHAIERKHVEYRQTLLTRILEELNWPSGEQDPITNILATIKEITGLEAIGLRLRNGHDYPYYATLGLPESFVSNESSLFARDENGRIVHDEQGKPVLECMCGNVVCGRTDPSLSFFTSRGSFWTNSTTRLLSSTTEQDRMGRTRNQCNLAGFESVALFPLRSGSEISGLLQLNDSRPDHFMPGMIESIEGLGDTLGIAISRIRTEEALKESEERLRAFMESATDSFTLFDSDLNLAEINQVSLRMWPPGTRKEDWLGKHITEIAPNVKETGRYDRYLEILETGEPVSFEDIVPHPRFGNRHLSVKAFRVLDGLGIITADITKRKKTEKELRIKNWAVQSSTNGIALADLEGILTYVNPAFLRMWGHEDASEILGIPAVEFWQVQDRAEEVVSVLQDTGHWVGELTAKRKDGSPLSVQLTASMVVDEAGRPVSMMASFADVTAQKQAEKALQEKEEQLRQSQKMEAIGSLAAGMAHDFNNLLSVITGYSGLTLDELGEGDPLRENLEEIGLASERAAQLTNQLLAFSRKQVIEPRILDLNDLVTGMENMLGRLLGEDLGLAFVLDPDLGRIRADAGQIEQVLLNLVVNAREAMPRGGRLTIETRNVHMDEELASRYLDVEAGTYVLLAVSDTGRGMGEEVRRRVFEPFFTTKGKGKGTGLGLATVYGIVKQSGGDIRVYSEPGQGTTFKVYLPLVEGDVEVAGADGMQEAPTAGTETILVAEDEEVLLKLVARILGRCGYTVIEASSAGEALMACERHQGSIDLMVTDVIMPQMSGRELADRLRALRPEMKVIYMSGYTDNAIAHHGILEEGIRFIQKPFSAERIAGKVREVLDEP